MYDALYAGDLTKAGGLKRQLTPKMAALFMFPSPTPVKAVLNAQGAMALAIAAYQSNH